MKIIGICLVIVAALCIVAPLSAGTASVPSGNLVQNPGAEDSAGVATSTQVGAPAGWTTTGGVSAVQYTTSSGFLTPDDSTKVAGGANFFAGGPKTGVGTATQTIDVSAASAEIDAGNVVAKLSALLGGYLDQRDSARVEAAFLDSTGARLGAVRAGPVTAADRKDETTLLSRAASGIVPKGTVQITVTIAATRQEGDYNDGYVDNVSLELSVSAAPTTPSPPRTSPKAARVKLVVMCVGTKVEAVVHGKTSQVSSVRFLAGGKVVATVRKAPFSARFGNTHRKAVKVTARVRVGSRTVVVAKTARHC